MVSFRNLLLIFGGCEGGKDDKDSFDDVLIIDIENRASSKAAVTGKRPKGREGHAAGVIDNLMIIYGGQGEGTLYEDIFALNLETFEWRELEKHGSLPGPRESMASTVISGTLYVFGGNISTRNSEEDEYTNDLYSIYVKNNSALCKYINCSGNLPPKRLSHSMSNLNNHFLILCGGESYGKTLNDVWVFSVENNSWREVTPINQLRGRMTHICFAYKDTLLVFGGMTHEKAVLNELAVLNFGNNKIQNKANEFPSRHGSILSAENQRSNSFSFNRLTSQFVCYDCGHDSGSCDFFERHPEAGNPSLSFHTRVQVPPFTMHTLKSNFPNKWSALLRVCELLGSYSVSINVTGEIGILANIMCKIDPPYTCLDLSNLPVDEDDETIELRTMLLTGWKRKSANKALIIEVYSKIELSPEELCKSCSGFGTRSFASAVLGMSDRGLIISKGDEFISVCLIHSSEFYLPMYFIVFNSARNPVFPHKEIFQANLTNIFTHSHLKDLDHVFFRPNGTFVYIYSTGLDVVGNDILDNDKSLKALLEKDRMVKYSLICNEIVSCDSKRQIIQDNVHFSVSKVDSDVFSVLIYFKKKIIYWEYKKEEGKKRQRSDCIEIEVKDKNLVNPLTGHIDWYQMSGYYRFIVDIINS